MPDNDIVQIDIVVANAGPSRAGFGLMMIPSHNAPWGDRLRLYEDASDAVTDGYPSDSPEVRALRKIFSQNPKPPRVAIGRITAAVTQVYELIVQDALDTPYVIDVAGEGVTDTEVSVTPEGGDDEGDIAGDLVTALNAVEGKNYTAAVDGTDPNMIIVTGSAPGEWFSLSVRNVALLSIRQTHTVANLEDDLDAIKDVNDDWYVVYPLYSSKDYVSDVAAWCAANDKLCVFDTVDSDTITAAHQVGVTTDVGSTLLALGYSGVSGMYHHNPAQFAAAAWMGRWLPTTPGQSNPAWRPLEGVSPTLLTATQRTNLLARRMNYYRFAFGQSFTWQGTVFSTTYRFLDVRRNADWLENAMLTNIVAALAGAEIVGYDDAGIQVIAGAAESALAEGTDQGVLTSNPKYALEVPLAENISSGDKAARVLRKLKWNAALRGAINTVVPVKGTLTF